MVALKATRQVVVGGVLEDQVVRARGERLSRGLGAAEEMVVTGEEFDALAREEFQSLPRHGPRSKDDLTVIFNRFRFHDSEEEQQRRKESFPALNRHKFNGYGGFEWRDSGSGEFRRRTGAGGS